MWGITLLLSLLQIARSHSDLRFLTLFVSAGALMQILVEVDGILKEPDEDTAN